MAKAAAVTVRRNTKRVLAALAAGGVARRTRALVRESPPLRVLGLDLNTSSTGYAVLCERGRVREWGHVPTAQLPSADVLGIARAVDTALADVHARVSADCTDPVDWRVGIEDFMRTYRFGRFHTKGIFQLAQLNGVVSYACWRRFSGDAQPVHTHPSAARGFFGIAATTTKKGTARKGGESDIKEQVMAFVQRKWLLQQQQQLEREEPRHREPRLFLLSAGVSGADGVDSSKLFARTRGGNFPDAALDVADAYVIAAFTRWRHFHDQLLLDEALAAQFAAAYMELTMAHADARKSSTPTAEERLLQSMDTDARQMHLRSLFAHGVDEWVRLAQADTAMWDGDSDA